MCAVLICLIDILVVKACTLSVAAAGQMTLCSNHVENVNSN
jgi:hypothetical protein